MKCYIAGSGEWLKFFCQDLLISIDDLQDS